MTAAPKPLTICLAGSGGGHVRQLLDLEGVWSSHNYYFLTEDSALSRSLAEKHPVRYVSHVALGQARLGSPFRMAWHAVLNFFQSAKAIIGDRPDYVISTGAGAVFFGILWAKLFGAKIIMIESFARFDRPSAFARIASPFADFKIVQSAKLLEFIPDAKVFDPLKVFDKQRPEKKKLIFATVGATLPFNRMIEAVGKLKADGLIEDDVVVQTGVGGVAPPGVKSFETLPFEQMQSYLRDADIVVCHGGTGSLITALREGCRVIVMPREFERGEHYDNHQSEIASAFAARGLVMNVRNTEELGSAIKTARTRPALFATTDTSALTSYVVGLLKQSPRAAD